MVTVCGLCGSAVQRGIGSSVQVLRSGFLVLVDQRQRARLVAGRFRVMRRTMGLIATCGTALASSVSHRLGWGRPPARRNTADAVSNRNGRTMPNNASV